MKCQGDPTLSHSSEGSGVWPHLATPHFPADRTAMTTGQCCHLPGSLCDCTGGADLSKAVQEADGRQARYVTQVTTKDGRLLSTDDGAAETQDAGLRCTPHLSSFPPLFTSSVPPAHLCPLLCLSDGPICRICHEGGNGEGLLSPCDCTGTLGTVHRSCLEKWLSSSNTSYCELCHTEFSVERRPRPLTEWLQDPGPRNEKRTLLCDMVCFLFITPLAAISGWLCLRGAQDHLHFNSRLEAVGLIALTIALFTIYVLWTLVSFRYHCQLYSEWRRTNQKVRLLIPDIKAEHSAQHSLLSTKLVKKTADETIV
ncbi:E3 ubiquitin-protein ligase MARCH2-like [Scleropages formosus]|uniref:E3 ubiquitin-protein ligase MARCHF2 n=1 Tax=Scleropages formosus TaxID=113540 RepID=A0A0P7UMR3_SCLFO|nr:E3 ubiquitin-protein ligase MARCH2-like [Scleropages formosus]